MEGSASPSKICFPGNFSAELKGELLNGNRSYMNFRGLRSLRSLRDFWKEVGGCTITQHSAEALSAEWIQG
jgi:hypothetical protein